MVDLINIILGIVTALTPLVAAIYYRKRWIEAEKRYNNLVSPKPISKSIKSDAQTERERWLEIRSKILLRDHFRCQECGYYKHLEVHHIVPKSKGGGDNPENLVTLCTRCHGKVHGFKKHIGGNHNHNRNHKHGKHRNRNRRRKEKRYFKEHTSEFVFSSVPPPNWDQMPENVKKERRDEMYELWVHNRLNQPRPN
jgi:hypothetical protein